MLDERENRNLERHLHAKEIMDRYMTFTDDRFHTNNEWRGALQDKAKEDLPRSEFVVQHAALSEKIDAVSSRVTFIMGVGFGVNFILITAVTLLSFMRH